MNHKFPHFIVVLTCLLAFGATARGDLQSDIQSVLKHNNDRVLSGDGDPSLGDVEMLRKSGWGVTSLFKNWAEQLKKANLTTFDRLLVDDSIFDEQFLHPHWPPEQVHKRYVAQVAGLNLNANCVDFYIRITTP